MADVLGGMGLEEASVTLRSLFPSAPDSDEVLVLHPTDGGSPLSFPELGKHTEAVAWALDGNLWVRPGILQSFRAAYSCMTSSTGGC